MMSTHSIHAVRLEETAWVGNVVRCVGSTLTSVCVQAGFFCWNSSSILITHMMMILAQVGQVWGPPARRWLQWCGVRWCGALLGAAAGGHQQRQPHHRVAVELRDCQRCAHGHVSMSAASASSQGAHAAACSVFRTFWVVEEMTMSLLFGCRDLSLSQISDMYLITKGTAWHACNASLGMHLAFNSQREMLSITDSEPWTPAAVTAVATACFLQAIGCTGAENADVNGLLLFAGTCDRSCCLMPAHRSLRRGAYECHHAVNITWSQDVLVTRFKVRHAGRTQSLSCLC